MPELAEAEPLVLLQPSLHSLDGFVEAVLDEAEALGAEVSDLRDGYEAEGLSDDDSEIHGAIERLQDLGYVVVYENDTFAVYPEGTTIPEEW